ncbi:hypothetical protein TRIP_C20624 [Candidatus Zixiibacteriota bacterium]|nr:hypothetical protein TRIP_C20624 [candidate division Zixibacteria bacterium]
MKKTILIYSATAVGLAAIWFFLLMAPLMQKNRETRVAIDTAEQKLTDMERILLEFPEKFRSEHDLLMQKKILVAQLYSKEDLIKLFDNIKSKAASADLNLLEITPSIEELLALNSRAGTDDQPQELNLTVRLSGGLHNLGQFINQMEDEKFYQGTNFCKINGTYGGKSYPEMAYGFKAVLGTLGNI